MMRSTGIKMAAIAAALVAGGAGVQGCRTSGSEQSATKDTQIRPFEGELGMKPGVGYETIYEDVRGTCIDFDGVETSSNAQQVIYELNLIENHRELGTQLGVSSAATVKAAVPQTNVNVSAKTKFSLGASYTLNRYSVYVLAKVEIRNESTHIKNARPTEAIKAKLQNPTDDSIDDMRLQCGDAFLSTYTTGGEFFGVIEIKTETEEQQLEVKRDVETAVAAEGIGEASSQNSFELRIKNAVKNRNVRVYTYQRGGSGAEQIGLVDTVDEMMKRITDLPTFVTQGSGNAANYTATFKDYFTLGLGLPASYRKALLSAQDTIGELAGLQMEMIDLKGDVNYVISHANSFENVTPQKIDEMKVELKKVSGHMKKIFEAARDCHRTFRECRIPDDVAATPKIALPKRKTTIQQLAKDVIAVKTVLQQINVDALYEGPFNPPDCYLEIRAVAPDGQSKRVRRTPTDYESPRCDQLSKSFDLPLSMLTEAYKSLGISPMDGSIQILVRDDDGGYGEDETIGSLTKPYKDIQQGSALIDTLTGDYITMSIELEVR